MKKKKQLKTKFTAQDYIQAVKRADREISLENSSGFKAVTRIHQSKKTYKRKEGKKIDFDTLF
jgi:ribosomal protein L14